MFPLSRERRDDGAHFGHGEVLADATPRTEPEREECTLLFLRRGLSCRDGSKRERVGPDVRVAVDAAQVDGGDLARAEPGR